MENELFFSTKEVVDIAKFQRITCWIIVVIILGAIYCPPIVLFAYIAQIVCSYYLAKTLKLTWLWVYVIGMFLPIVAPVFLTSLICRSIEVLRDNGIRVGIMGANQEDLNNFINPV